jgi:hypothetical protein
LFIFAEQNINYKVMNILLSVTPDEIFSGIVNWVLVILGIIVLVKFFRIADDVRKIKEDINKIANSNIRNIEKRSY